MSTVYIFGTKDSEACSIGALLPNLRGGRVAQKGASKNGPKQGDTWNGYTGTIPIRKEKQIDVTMKKRKSEEVDWEILTVSQSEYKETCSEIKWWQIDNVLKNNSFPPVFN